jgi:hypothetical protein
MAIDQRLLHWMQSAGGAAEVFDGKKRFAVQRGQELDTGVDGPQIDPALAVQFTHHHGTGAAIAFGAAFLGAAAMQIFAQELKHRSGRSVAGRFLDLATVVKTDSLSLYHANPVFSSDSTKIALARPGNIRAE